MKLVLFDVDGTLIDSQHLIVAAMEDAYRAHDRPPPARNAILSVVGLSLPQAFAMLAGDDPAFPAESFADAYKQAFFRLSADPAQQAPLFPGARAVIDALAQRDGVTLGLATGKSRRGVDRMLDLHGLKDAFATVQTADDHPSKPAPDMVFAAMAEAGAGAAETVLLGDTTFDMEMTRAAGALPIGAGWGYHPPAALAAAGAHAVLDDFAAFLPAFERLCDTKTG
ncbi:HAD-IA family hydrolase [Blastochloris sulfoviridis]|uniref:HAD-IA family hydrolase n=1 Tax=Blastochloris sulfoviridis TaxID=50712 RepID=A0A5M6I6R7_9HYPH|nr:HAD-IA family hydrolase [Blastochloris sulfoviridis]KAA5603577.1 HAD-IA family hydrolase [Blastochloris sulfoviridis]